MKPLSLPPTLWLLAAGFALFAALLLLRSDDAPSEPDWQPVAEAVAPSAANVAPTVHSRLMRLEQRIEAAPDDTTALLELARLKQDAHQHEAAAAYYERFLALSPQNHQAWLDLAHVYAGQGLWDEARDASERLLARYPGDASAMYNLGAIAANGGEADEARRWWESVREGEDEALAAQATASLAQLDGTASSAPARSASPRPNPHAGLSAFGQPAQPVVAHRVRGLSAE